MKDHGFPHYIDFWLFDDRYEGNKTKCAGRLVEDDSSYHLGDFRDDEYNLAEGDFGYDELNNFESTSQQRGCDKWYWHYTAKSPPTFERNKHFPPVYQVRRYTTNHCSCFVHHFFV